MSQLTITCPSCNETFSADQALQNHLKSKELKLQEEIKVKEKILKEKFNLDLKLKEKNLEKELSLKIQDQNKAKLKDGYFIIDGTIPYNDELPFTAKDDIFMHEPALAIHGLAAPQLGCGTCQSTPSQLGNVSNVAYNGFQDYLDWLVANGVSDHVVDNIEQTVNFYLSQGVDPSFVPSKTGVKINNVYFDYGVPHKALGSTQSQEIDYSTIFNTVSNTSYFNNTFGAIFANGFDVTCWGSSNSPSQTKTEVPVDANYYLNQSGLRLVVNQDNLNKFALMTTAYIKARDMDRNDNNVANCTKKSGEVGYQLMKKFRDDVINGIKNKLQQAGVQVETTIVSQLVHVPAPSGFFDGIIHLNNVQVPVYTFSEAYEDTGLDNNVGIDDGGFYGNDRLDDDPSTAGGFGMFLLVAAAAGAVVYRKKLFGSK